MFKAYQIRITNDINSTWGKNHVTAPSDHTDRNCLFFFVKKKYGLRRRRVSPFKQGFPIQQDLSLIELDDPVLSSLVDFFFQNDDIRIEVVCVCCFFKMCLFFLFMRGSRIWKMYHIYNDICLYIYINISYTCLHMCIYRDGTRWCFQAFFSN